MGLEALSRGASETVFVERSPTAVRALQANVESLGATGAEILNADARDFLAGSDARSFDIVFLDPPFKAELHDELCRLLQKKNWLAVNARIYIESDKDQPDVKVPEGWRVLKSKTAGNVRYMLATIEV